MTMRPLAVLLILLLGACAERVTPVLTPPAQAARVWPQLPDPPRYAYAGTLVGERDFIARKEGDAKPVSTSFLEVLTGLIFGEGDYEALARPVAGMVDGQGRILVADAGRAAIAVFDMKGKRFQLWQTGSDEESFISPVGIAEDGAGGFYVSDSTLGQVFRLSHDGTPVEGSLGRGVLARPTGVARDAVSGKIYVADTAAHRIVVFSPAGEVVDVIGSRGSELGAFNYPTHLTIKGESLYVADSLNFRIQVFDLDGDGKLSLGQLGINVGNLTRPKGVAVGRDGRIYVVESYYDHLLIYGSDGEFLLPIGGSGNEVGQFYLPAGVWTDDQGRVFVADMFNGRIAVFQELTVGGEG